jgi:hypothetical protein
MTPEVHGRVDVNEARWLREFGAGFDVRHGSKQIRSQGAGTWTVELEQEHFGRDGLAGLASLDQVCAVELLDPVQVHLERATLVI